MVDLAGASGAIHPHLPALLAWFEGRDAMAQQHPPPLRFDRLLQLVTEHLHRTVEMPQPERCLDHLQDGGAVEGCGSIGGLLGIELQLEVEEPPQARVVAATTELEQVGHGQPGQQAGCNRCRAKSRDQLAKIPE